MKIRAFSKKNSLPRSTVSRGVYFFMFCLLVKGSALGQPGQTQTSTHVYGTDRGNAADLAVAMDKLRRGNFLMTHLEVIAEAGESQAIPLLEEQFAHSQDRLAKLKIAEVLVRLGDHDERYWEFLMKQAKLAVGSPAPELIDAQGKIVPGQLAPDFIAWAKANDVVPDAVFEVPASVFLLGETGDSRGIPLLRQALESPNYFIENAAARGLAQIQDKASVPLIIQACQKARPDVASAIAQSLVYFDDARAQSAVDMYLPKDFAKSLREARAHGAGPFH